MSTLDGATSCFKTFFGPTSAFNVLSSVRQGDPLSPLVYIFVTDALHEGLKDNPLDEKKYKTRIGYTVSNAPRTTVNSTGYADDMMIYAETWSAIWAMHQWVREFSRAHAFKINTHKTHFLISNFKGELDNRWLYSVDGKEKICPQGPDLAFAT